MAKSAMLILLSFLAVTVQQVQGVYFYAQKYKWRCFQDIVSKNNVSGPETRLTWRADPRNGGADPRRRRAADDRGGQ